MAAALQHQQLHSQLDKASKTLEHLRLQHVELPRLLILRTISRLRFNLHLEKMRWTHMAAATIIRTTLRGYCAFGELPDATRAELGAIKSRLDGLVAAFRQNTHDISNIAAPLFVRRFNESLDEMEEVSLEMAYLLDPEIADLSRQLLEAAAAHPAPAP